MDITSSLVVSGTGDGASAGSVAFNTLTQNQRPGLALVNGVVYVTWASHGDRDPYHGWVVGYSAANLAQPPIVFNDSPNGSRSGIWMSGGAPAADNSNNLYLITGNGTYDGTAKSDYGDTFLKLSTSGGVSVADWFTPADESSLEGGDTDSGSGGAAILVDQPSGPMPPLMDRWRQGRQLVPAEPRQYGEVQDHKSGSPNSRLWPKHLCYRRILEQLAIPRRSERSPQNLFFQHRHGNVQPFRSFSIPYFLRLPGRISRGILVRHSQRYCLGD
jgi:hypothetical protein